jgi:DNA-binding transcriptional ArsR family regulator
MDPEQKPSGRVVVQDTATMRALAHPARMASLEHLMRGGPATATELGRIAGLTPSAMSYHLRLLERAGLISTAPGRGDGRERVWQSNRTGGWEIDTLDDGTEDTRAVSAELLRSVLSVQELQLNRWLSRASEPGWLDTGYFVENAILVNHAELVALGEQIQQLMDQYRPANRTDPPADAVLHRAALRSFPITDPLPEGDVKE